MMSETTLKVLPIGIEQKYQSVGKYSVFGIMALDEDEFKLPGVISVSYFK